jgi:hypothetical protein
VARVGLQAAEALGYAHARGVLHRDVKPSNLLLDTAGNVWITDFGLAKMLADPDNLTHTGDFVGTLRYMAPERFNGHGDARSDVYSLGLTLYELLTLRPAFMATDRTRLIHTILHEEPERPRVINPKVPRDLETIVLKAIEHDPSCRYATAREMAEDLQRFLENRPIKARPVGTLEQAAKWARRRPDVAALVTSIVLVLILGIGVSSYFAFDAHQKARTADLNAQAASANEEKANENAQKARDKEKEARENEQKANEARAELEVTLARSLVRPIGPPSDSRNLNSRSSPVGENELEAIWELAEITNDRIRLLVIEQALSRPGTLRQFTNRRHMAIHATVGLDRSRRQRVQELLIARLRNEHQDGQMVANCGMLAITLGDLSPETTKKVARALADGVSRETNPITRIDFASGLDEMAVHLEPGDAATMARTLLDILAKERDYSVAGHTRYAWRKVVQRMAPDDKVATARALVETLTKTSDARVLFNLSLVLDTVAAQLEPSDAAAVTRYLIECLTYPYGESGWAYAGDGLKAVSARLEPGDAAAAARVLVERLRKENDPVVLSCLARGLGEMAARLERKEAARHAAVATPILIDTFLTMRDNSPFSAPLQQGLQAVAVWLEPDDAATAARALADALTKQVQGRLANGIVLGLRHVAARLRPGDAAAVAHTLMDAQEGTTNPFVRIALAEGLVEVADRLTPDDMEPVARVLINILTKDTHTVSTYYLTTGLRGVVIRLEPEKAAEYISAAAHALIVALTRATTLQAQANLALGLGALAPRLSPSDAAAAARAIIDVLASTTSQSWRSTIEYSLVEVASRLEPGDAATLANALTDALTKTTNPDEVMPLVRRLRAVGPRLGQEEFARQASVAARALTDALAKATDQSTQVAVGQQLRTLSAPLGPTEIARQYVLATRAIGEMLSPPTSLSALAALSQASKKPLQSWFTTQQLVDLLKMPTCVGPVRTAILDLLGRRYERTFTDQWKFIDYAEKYLPDIDLKSPPKRPGR